MKGLRYRSAAFELKAVNTAEGTFEGYASVFGNVDSYRDVIEHGAFTKTLKEFGHRVKVLWQHDPWTPIGRPVEMQEDDKGLYVKSKISDTNAGRDALTLLRDGVINELSIGYTSIKETWEKETGLRRIQELKLWEFSPVTWAANDLAVITGVKSLDEIEPLLRRASDLADELKAGKVLSEKNRQLVEQTRDSLKGALDLLEALLAAAEPDTGKSTRLGAEPPTPGADPANVQSVLALLNELKGVAI